MKNLFYSCLITIAIGCSKEKETKVAVQNNKVENTEIDSIQTVPEPVKLSKDEMLKNINSEILSALKSKDYEHFSEFIHPEKGIRISMYAYVKQFRRLQRRSLRFRDLCKFQLTAGFRDPECSDTYFRKRR